VSFRLSRLRVGEWTIAAGSVILLASMLLAPWFTPARGHSLDGWHGLAHAHWLLVVSTAVGLAAAVLQASRRSPAIPVTISLIAGLLGAGSTVWLLYRVLLDPPGSREVGGFIGLLGAVTIAYGGWRSLRQEGIAPEDGPGEIPTVELRPAPRG